jgi:ATP-binding cassette subfamily B protein
MVTQESLSDHIALIPQCVPLFQRSVLDNLRMAAPNASLKDMEDVCKKAKIHQEIMGMPDAYHTLLGDHGLPLSEATRQGFAVARALLKKAPILIVEESPSVLDTPTERLIESSLNAIMEDSTATQLVLAHKLSTLIHMDRILIFDKGSLVQDGTHDQLSKESGGIYKKLLDDRYRHF